VNVDLPRLHLGFLKTDDVSGNSGEKIVEPFVDTSPKPINIPGY
jgi:hypothetical protein